MESPVLQFKKHSPKESAPRNFQILHLPVSVLKSPTKRAGKISQLDSVLCHEFGSVLSLVLTRLKGNYMLWSLTLSLHV